MIVKQPQANPTHSLSCPKDKLPKLPNMPTNGVLSFIICSQLRKLPKAAQQAKQSFYGVYLVDKRKRQAVLNFSFGFVAWFWERGTRQTLPQFLLAFLRVEKRN